MFLLEIITMVAMMFAVMSTGFLLILRMKEDGRVVSEKKWSTVSIIMWMGVIFCTFSGNVFVLFTPINTCIALSIFIYNVFILCKAEQMRKVTVKNK